MNIYAMRDMYNNIPGFQADEINFEDDPFYEPAPWFQFQGRAHVYLRNLLLGIPFSLSSPIISERGEKMGDIFVDISAPSFKEEPSSESGERSPTTMLSLELGSHNLWAHSFITDHLLEKERPSREVIEKTFEENGISVPQGKYLCFSITVQKANNLSSEKLSDVFCQIKFLNTQASSFSSNPPCNGMLVIHFCWLVSPFSLAQQCEAQNPSTLRFPIVSAI